MTVSKNDWSDEEYAVAVKGAEEVFKATARVRAVLPWGCSTGDRYVVSGPVLSKVGGTWIADVAALPGSPVLPLPPQHATSPTPFQQYSEFTLTLQQLGDSNLLERLARRAALDVAAGEGRKIFHRIQQGTTEIVRYGRWEDFKYVLNRAVERLQEQNQVGPYVLLMQSKLHSKFRQLVSSSNGRVFLGEALGGDLRDATIAEEGYDGLLISLGVETVEIVDTQPLALNLIRQARNGWTFQLDEWLAVRVIDPSGIVYLESKASTNLGTISYTTANNPTPIEPMTCTIHVDGSFEAQFPSLKMKGRIEKGSGACATFYLPPKQSRATLKGDLEGWVEVVPSSNVGLDGKIELS